MRDPLQIPPLSGSVFLRGAVAWGLFLFSGFRGSGVHVSGCGGEGFCGLSVEGAQGIKGHCDVGRFVQNASPGMEGFGSFFP